MPTSSPGWKATTSRPRPWLRSSPGSVIPASTPPEQGRAIRLQDLRRRRSPFVSQVEELGFDNFWQHAKTLTKARSANCAMTRTAFAALLVTDINTQNSPHVVNRRRRIDPRILRPSSRTRFSTCRCGQPQEAAHSPPPAPQGAAADGVTLPSGSRTNPPHGKPTDGGALGNLSGPAAFSKNPRHSMNTPNPPLRTFAAALAFAAARPQPSRPRMIATGAAPFVTCRRSRDRQPPTAVRIPALWAGQFRGHLERVGSFTRKLLADFDVHAGHDAGVAGADKPMTTQTIILCGRNGVRRVCPRGAVSGRKFAERCCSESRPDGHRGRRGNEPHRD